MLKKKKLRIFLKRRTQVGERERERISKELRQLDDSNLRYYFTPNDIILFYKFTYSSVCRNVG